MWCIKKNKILNSQQWLRTVFPQYFSRCGCLFSWIEVSPTWASLRSCSKECGKRTRKAHREPFWTSHEFAPRRFVWSPFWTERHSDAFGTLWLLLGAYTWAFRAWISSTKDAGPSGPGTHSSWTSWPTVWRVVGLCHWWTGSLVHYQLSLWRLVFSANRGESKWNYTLVFLL